MAKSLLTLLICLLLYGSLIIPFRDYLYHKPFVEKLGYVPSVTALRIIAVDQKELLGASLVIKVLMYFGGLVQKAENLVKIAPDYKTMSRLLHGAVMLDPYNMDAYYFAQSFLTWDAKQYKVANDLLDHGMKFRTWDSYLPFFAGFNCSYFLKDYASAARYFERAGELSGVDLPKLLAGRYMQESGQTDLAISYLTAMEKGQQNQAIRKYYQLRLAAFREVRRIETAVGRYKELHGIAPVSIEQLMAGGLLSSRPIDPYGGQFYLDVDGKVATTSKYAFAGARKDGKLLQESDR